MKIIHINFAKTWRGGERQVFLLMQGLQKAQIEQVLICRKGSALEEKAAKAGLKFYALPKMSFLSVFQARILKRLEAKGFNIVHCHESKAHTLGILGKLFWKTNQKLIIHRRVIFPIKRKLTTAVKYSEKHIARMICISKAVEEVIKTSIGFKNTVIIPDMVETKSPPIPVISFRKKHNIKSRFLVGYIAALTAEKDHITFLNTAKLILDSYDLDVHFAIVGDGDLKENLIQYSENLGIAENVTFTGFVNDVENIITEIDVLLFTSTAEGLGSTVLDFFVAKKPVVATKSGGVDELITDEETGFLCEKGDWRNLSSRVQLVLTDSRKSREITEKAFNFVKRNFGIDHITKMTLQVYRSVENSGKN